MRAFCNSTCNKLKTFNEGTKKELNVLLNRRIRSSNNEASLNSLLIHLTTGGPTYCNEGVLEYSNV